MARRLNTVIIVPHSKAKFLKFSFSTRTGYLAVLAVVVAVALSTVAIVYTGNAVSRRAEVRRLKTENQQLHDVNKHLEVTIAQVQKHLDEFEERTSRLALAAGMEGAGEAPEQSGESGARAGRGGPYDRVPETPKQIRTQEEWIAKRLDLVESSLGARDKALASTPTVTPVMGVITDGFGRRKDPFTGRWAMHRGLDIAARRGTVVEAPADGVVTFVGRDGGFGKVVKISHGFGFTTVFGHLSSMSVSTGDEVHRGDKIGAVGSTGRSTGPHLHYEVHVDGRAVNPLYYILNAF
ncbi:MAG: M23 family metallopeptidase [Acidobacteria bacterium]|jgi:murein DD-endopeptidase MepM/ murein hydrolase activator NlpD|nr:M23 family metallopeptidase [Acidobacteriota bacterium]